MRGAVRPVSLARKFIIDLIRVSVPLVVIKRTMNLERLAKAQSLQDKRTSLLPIIAKAFCIVARDEPWLRTFYIRWPWPHFYEVPRSVAMAVIIRDDFERDATFVLKIGTADEHSLTDLEAIIHSGKSLPFDDVPVLRRTLHITRMPLPLRRLFWILALNIGRQRANWLGTFGITSLSALGSETVVARTPGPAFITYGAVRSDYTMDLLFHWDHRIYDGILAARALRQLEDVLNTVIADELLASGSPKSPPG
jgi:hypothetical protein